MNTIEEELQRVRTLCTNNLKIVSPIMLKYILRYVTDVPQFIQSVIIFGSSSQIGYYHPGSDIDIILIVDDYGVLKESKEELKEYEARVTEVDTDILIEDYQGFVDAMNNGNSLNKFYREMWEKGIMVYCSEELIRRKHNERINKRQKKHS